MTLDPILRSTAGKPHLYRLLRASPESFRISPERADVQIWRVSVPPSDKADALFREFARSLRFPKYFGENYNALSDCYADLSWLGPESKIVVLEHSERLSRIPGGEFLCGLLCRAARWWEKESASAGLGNFLRTVLVESPAGQLELEELLRLTDEGECVILNGTLP